MQIWLTFSVQKPSLASPCYKFKILNMSVHLNLPPLTLASVHTLAPLNLLHSFTLFIPLSPRTPVHAAGSIDLFHLLYPVTVWPFIDTGMNVCVFCNKTVKNIVISFFYILKFLSSYFTLFYFLAMMYRLELLNSLAKGQSSAPAMTAQS